MSTLASLREIVQTVYAAPVTLTIGTTTTSALWLLICYFFTRNLKKRRAYRDALAAFYFRNLDIVSTAEAAEIFGIFRGVGVVGDVEVTREDIRDELIRDPVATGMMVDDDTPEDVQRYLYLEALCRARLRKLNLLDDSDNDLFAAPRQQIGSDAEPSPGTADS